MFLSLCFCVVVFFFFFKQKTAYELRISDWSSDVCSSDLNATGTLYFQNIDALREGLLSNGGETNPSAEELALGEAVGAEGNFTATGDVNDAAAAFKRTTWSIFAQDDWEVTDRLNAVVGVRADW